VGNGTRACATERQAEPRCPAASAAHAPKGIPQRAAAPKLNLAAMASPFAPLMDA